MRKRQIESLMRQIDKEAERLGKDRDRLDDLISHAEGLKDDCETAHGYLIDARDALSQLV